MRRSVLLLGAVLTQLLLATAAAQEPPHLKELHLIPSYCPAPCIDYELSAELQNDWMFAADQSSSTLFPECLDDWIDEDKPVRVIDAFVEAIGLGVVPEATSRPIIPWSLLKLYIYGYLNRVQPSRRLEEAGRKVEVCGLIRHGGTPMRFRSLVLASLGILLSIAGCSSTPSGAPPAATSREAASPEAARPSGSLGSSGPVNPANFTSKIDNHWYPLAPGTTLTYRGVKDRKLADRAVAVTDRTIVIAGVTCVVVEDKLFFAGEPAERNFDYYAQDRQGNVWNFGEDAQEIESGQVVATEGWRAGLDGALPSLVMEAAPAVGDAFANDYTKDHFAVVSLAESVKVPYGAFTDALLTKEWTPIEREVLTHKYYVRGIGEVRDVAVRGPKEEFVLVAVAR